MGIAGDIKEFGGIGIGLVERQRAIPGPDRDIGDGVAFARNEAPLGQLAVQHVKLAFHLHRKAVDRIFPLLRRIGEEMAKAAPQIGGRSHLPEQPVQAFRLFLGTGTQKSVEPAREIQQDGTGFKDPARRRYRAVEQGRNLGIRIDRDKAAAELVAFADLDQPGVIFRPGMTRRQQFFQQDGHLDAIRGGQRVKLERMLPHGEHLVMCRAGNGAVDAGELPAIVLVPGPDAGRDIRGCIGHLSAFLQFSFRGSQSRGAALRFGDQGSGAAHTALARYLCAGRAQTASPL